MRLRLGIVRDALGGKRMTTAIIAAALILGGVAIAGFVASYFIVRMIMDRLDR